MTTEQDLRLKLFNTLLTTPHRDLASIYPVHQEILKADPRFYVQLAAWYFAEGEVRDHKEVFVTSLALSDFPGHRDVGLALLRQLPPYEVGRVVDFVKGHELRRRVKSGRRRGDGNRKAGSVPQRAAVDEDRGHPLPARARGRRRLVRQLGAPGQAGR